MRISIIEPVGGHGGMDYYDYGLAYGLGANGVDVIFYTSNNTRIREFENVQTKLFFNNVWGSPFLKKSWLYIKGHIASYINSKKEGVKIVHLHFFFFRGIDLLILLIAKTFGLKIVVTVHDVNSFHNNSKRIIEKWCYKLINGIIVHNHASLHIMQSKNVHIKNSAIIPHGNYLPFITKVSNDKKSSGTFNLLFFGQIKSVKGVDVLLKALERVITKNKNVNLVIAGKPWKSDLSIYNKMIQDLGLQSFVKTDFRYIPDEETGAFFENADLIVLPYKEIYQSGVLLLAMSYGKPLLCSDLKPFKEIIIDKKNGFIFKSEDDEDLAFKILEIMSDVAMLNSISINASETIHNDYDWVAIGKRTIDFYQLLLSE